MDAPTGSIIAYATAPGAVASDGTDQNGLYSSMLLKHLKTPDLEIGRMFRRVRVDVLEASGQAQIPWESSSLTGEFFFVPKEGELLQTARVKVERAKDSGEVRDLVLDEPDARPTAVASLPKLETLPDSRPVKDRDRRRVAILYFDNSGGRPEFDSLRKGLADMMITDLSKVHMLKIVERDKLEAILKEQNLQGTKQFDQATVVKIGKLLGAEIIMAGAFFEMFGQLRIDARMIDVETGRVLKAEGVNGKSEAFFGLKDQLVWQIAKNLDQNIARETLSASNPQDSLDQAIDYSEALDLYDAGDLKAAKNVLDKLLQYRPDFEPAKAMLAKLVSGK
jgi:TolB-like protein